MARVPTPIVTPETSRDPPRMCPGFFNIKDDGPFNCPFL
jgi:hypothetical protein